MVFFFFFPFPVDKTETRLMGIRRVPLLDDTDGQTISLMTVQCFQVNNKTSDCAKRHVKDKHSAEKLQL